MVRSPLQGRLHESKTLLPLFLGAMKVSGVQGGRRGAGCAPQPEEL